MGHRVVRGRHGTSLLLPWQVVRLEQAAPLHHCHLLSRGGLLPLAHWHQVRVPALGSGNLSVCPAGVVEVAVVEAVLVLVVGIEPAIRLSCNKTGGSVLPASPSLDDVYVQLLVFEVSGLCVE